MLLFRKGDDEEEVKKPADQSFWKVSGAGFMMILVAEFGDLTQIMTANLAARYDDPLSVGVGAVLALWAVAGLGILGGRTLMKYVPLGLITKIAAGVMLLLAGFSLYEAIMRLRRSRADSFAGRDGRGGRGRALPAAPGPLAPRRLWALSP